MVKSTPGATSTPSAPRAPGPGIILAGGQSLRMGSIDKPIARLNGIRLIDHALDLLKSQLDEIFISASHDYATGAPILPDRNDGPKGPAAALWAAIHDPHIKQYSGFITIPVDAPFAPKTDLVTRLAEKPKLCAFIQSPNQSHPVFAWWNYQILAKTLRQISHETNPSLRMILQKCQAIAVNYPDDRAFTNINSLAELEQAAQRFEAGSGQGLTRSSS